MVTKKQFIVQATPRNDMGKGASRRLRREEKVPAVIYGGGKEAVSLTLEHKEIIKSLKDEAFYSRILTLKKADESERVILKAVQRHPFKPRILHVDFQRVRTDVKLHMHIPLHFTGADIAPGVKDAGGIVSHIMSDVEVSCLPDDLPEYLEIDLSQMQLNQLLHLSDIRLPKGVEITALTHGNDNAVVSIHMPRIEEEPTLDAAETTSAADVPAVEQKGDEEPTKE